MKPNLIFVLFLFISIKAHSQNSNFNVDLNYPIPIDNNFVGENFNGIIGVGADYHFLELDPVNIGVSLNGGLLTDNDEAGPGNSSLITFQPKAVAELKLTPNGKVRPYIGIGYSFLFFRTTDLEDFTQGTASEVSQTESGLNINGGFTFDFTDRLFIKAQYDYIYLAPGEALDIKYNTRVNIFKVGVGYRI